MHATPCAPSGFRRHRALRAGHRRVPRASARHRRNHVHAPDLAPVPDRAPVHVDRFRLASACAVPRRLRTRVPAHRLVVSARRIRLNESSPVPCTSQGIGLQGSDSRAAWCRVSALSRLRPLRPDEREVTGTGRPQSVEPTAMQDAQLSGRIEQLGAVNGVLGVGIRPGPMSRMASGT